MVVQRHSISAIKIGTNRKPVCDFLLVLHCNYIIIIIFITLCSEKNIHFCFLAYLIEKVTNLNENFRQNS